MNPEILDLVFKAAMKDKHLSPLLKLPRTGGRNGFRMPTKTVQAKRHKRKSSRRWQKKWLKKFGTIEVPRWNVCFVTDRARDYSTKIIGAGEPNLYNSIIFQRRVVLPDNLPDLHEINETTANSVKKLIEKDIENYNRKRLSEMWIHHKINDL